MPDDSDPGLLLASLVEQVPGTRSAALLSAEGLVIADAGLGRDAADQLAAIASGFFSLARNAAVRSGGKDGVRQVLVETNDLLLFTVAAGRTAVVAALADRETDTGLLGAALARLAADVAPFLAGQPRIRGMVTRSAAE
jgi:predicted regulator of Ras-like GTPase activity (Roadblock/LC7/MglB family)